MDTFGWVAVAFVVFIAFIFLLGAIATASEVRREEKAEDRRQEIELEAVKNNPELAKQMETDNARAATEENQLRRDAMLASVASAAFDASRNQQPSVVVEQEEQRPQTGS